MIDFNAGKISISVDLERGLKIARILEDAFTNTDKIFSDTRNLIENQIPEGIKPLSREHALFLFYIVPLDYLMRSELLYARAKIMFKKERMCFDPWYIINTFDQTNLQELASLLQKYLGIRFPSEAAYRWYKNSISLLELYDGDPREIFRGSGNAKEILRKITQFRGFGRKTGTMLLRGAIDLGFVELKDIDDVLPPVDIHDIRIAFNTKIAHSSEYSEENARKFTRVIQNVWSYLCKEGHLDWLKVDRALWLLGSNGCAKGNCSICPINDFCSVRKQKILEKHPKK